MKKNIKFYVMFWTVLFVVFQVIAFVSPGWIGQEKYTPAFWSGYISIILAFVLNLIFAVMALYSNDTRKLFYNMTFLRYNYVGLILAFVVGGAFMLLSTIPHWVCDIISVIVIGSNLITLIKAKTAAKMVMDVDEKITKDTQFVKSLIADTQSLISVAKDEETRLLVKKVYEAARYSDPISNEQLKDIEAEINTTLAVFITAVRNDGDDKLVVADSLLYLIKNRNEKCKVLK